MPKDDFKAQVVGFNYSNIDGTGWPNAVSLDNGESVFSDGYAQRDYHPVDVKALLALADYFSTPCNDIDCRRCPLVKWCEEGWDSGHPITCIECGQMHAADVIRGALGVVE